MLVSWRLLLTFVVIGGWAWSAAVIAGEDAATVQARMRDRVSYLAADDREGRGTGSKGLDEAAEYLAREFASIGLKTLAQDGSPFQQLEVVTGTELGPAVHNRLTLIGPERDGQPRRVELQPGLDFNTLLAGGSNQALSAVVFVGYGITAPEHNYDDYAGLDVTNKVVVVLRKEPQQLDEKSVFAGNTNTIYASFATKINNAARHRAAGVILVNDLVGIEQAKGDQLLAPDGAGSPTVSQNLPVFFAKRSIIDEVVRSATGQDLAAWERQIDQGLQPASRELTGWRADAESSVKLVRVPTRNVLGVLEGQGDLADETVVVGAHYDHVGLGGPGAGSLAPWTHAVHNGADDNASGTAALLEIARSLAAARASTTATAPQSMRRIVFAAFAAEERGLLGSLHYVKNPLFPLASTVAMVNLDMVGRLDENCLTVFGTGTSDCFAELIDGLNKKYQFELTKDPAGRGPSDHQSFYDAKIPVLHFFTGTHPDYHRPSDDLDKINVEGMYRVTQLARDVVQHLATTPERPNYVLVRSRAVITSGGRPRPLFGATLEESEPGKGCRLVSVRRNGPADQAGLQSGDIVTQFGDDPINNMADLNAALKKFRPGDQVSGKATRDQAAVNFAVKLGQPR